MSYRSALVCDQDKNREKEIISDEHMILPQAVKAACGSSFTFFDII